jgi:hypothetical protein
VWERLNPHRRETQLANQVVAFWLVDDEASTGWLDVVARYLLSDVRKKGLKHSVNSFASLICRRET